MTSREKRRANRDAIAACMAAAGEERHTREHQLNRMTRKVRTKKGRIDWTFQTASQMARRLMEQRQQRKRA